MATSRSRRPRDLPDAPPAPAPASAPATAVDRILPAIAALVVFAAAFHTLIDPDIWFHLAAGRWILAHGIPRVDPFSYPSAGQPYVDLHWLFQIVVRGIHTLAGEAGLILFATLVILATYGLVYRLARREAPAPLAAGLTALGAILASERMSPRPEIVSFLLLAVTAWLVRRHREGSRRAWWILPLVFVLWVNSEGLFVLGYLALGAGLLASKDAWRDRRLWLSAALCVAAAFVNPWFAEGALHPFVLFTRISRELPIYSQTIGEFRGPFQDEAMHPAAALFPWYLGLIALALAARGRWPRLGEIVALGALVYLALSARRNLALLPLLATPILAGWLAQGELTAAVRRRFWIRRPDAVRRRLAAVAAALLVLGLAGYLHGIVTNRIYARAETNRRFGAGRAPVDFARGAASFLNEHRIEGPLFETFAAGSYFTWAVPSQKVFIDGRLEVHTARHYERYLRLRQGGAAWQQADQQYGFNAAVIQYMDAMDLALERLRDGSWAPVFLDDTAIIFLRRNERNAALIEQHGLTVQRLRERFPSTTAEELRRSFTLPAAPGRLARALAPVSFPWSHLHLGQFFLGLNRPDLAVPQLVAGIAAEPAVAAPRIMLAMALNSLQLPALGVEVLDSAEALGGSRAARARAWIVRGDLLNAAGRPAEAIDAYDRSLALLSRREDRPQVASLLASRASARLKAGDPNGAASDVQESLRLMPQSPQAWFQLGMIEEARGRMAEARQAYQRVAAMGVNTPQVEEALRRVGP